MKLNPEYSMFDENMFMQLRHALDGVTPPTDLELLDLSIGEPQIQAGTVLTDSLRAHNGNWQYYPKVTGTPAFIAAVCGYIRRRWPAAASLADLTGQILPVPGTREPLALLGGIVRNTKAGSVALVTNPFYHAWRAGALASGGEITFIDSHKETGFLPDLAQLDAALLDRTTLMYLCSPTNPHGSVMPLAYLVEALQLARRHDFLLIMDECYADIWRGDAPPSGMLEAAAALMTAGSDEDPLRNLVVVNSLSKRSSAAGLRAGFIIGDASVIAQYGKLVANGGSLVPSPVLEVAADLYSDETHVEALRAHYDTSFAIAERHLGVAPPRGGFFLWLEVGDDVAFVRRLMAEQGVRALPGRFMGAPGTGSNPAAGFVRFALVHDHDRINDAMSRVARLWHSDTVSVSC
jgi:N-succinyldiaminopimelate aminotransferase